MTLHNIDQTAPDKPFLLKFVIDLYYLSILAPIKIQLLNWEFVLYLVSFDLI